MWDRAVKHQQTNKDLITLLNEPKARGYLIGSKLKDIHAEKNGYIRFTFRKGLFGTDEIILEINLHLDEEG